MYGTRHSAGNNDFPLACHGFPSIDDGLIRVGGVRPIFVPQQSHQALIAPQTTFQQLRFGKQTAPLPLYRIDQLGRPGGGVGLFGGNRLVHAAVARAVRSEEHTSELQSLMRNSYAVFCLKKKKSKSHKNTSTI